MGAVETLLPLPPLLLERGAGRSQRRLFSCHIISDRAVNKRPLRPPGPLHSRMQVGARFNPPSPLCITAVNNGDIVRPPVLSLGPGRRLLNCLYSSRAKWGLNGPLCHQRTRL